MVKKLPSSPARAFAKAPERKSKKEMEAHLYLDSSGCLDVAGTAACLDAAE